MATATKTDTISSLKPGQVIRVHQRITEGSKERIQIFEGLIIDLHGHSGPNATFTVRRVIDGIGVEKIFPVESSFIDKVDVIKEAKVRRANLGYMRSRTGKSARMKDETILNMVLSKPHEVKEEEVVEAKPAEEKTDKNAAPAETVVESTPAKEEAAAEAPANEEVAAAEAPAEEKADEKKAE